MKGSVQWNNQFTIEKIPVSSGSRTRDRYISSLALNIHTELPGVLALTKHSLLKDIRFIVWPKSDIARTVRSWHFETYFSHDADGNG